MKLGKVREEKGKKITVLWLVFVEVYEIFKIQKRGGFGWCNIKNERVMWNVLTQFTV